MCFLNIKACQHILLHQIMIFKKASYDPFKGTLHFFENRLIFHYKMNRDYKNVPIKHSQTFCI